jgi:rhodanese-related sulfurtransferase
MARDFDTAMNQVDNVSPHGLAKQLQEPQPPQLLDCRELAEWQFCRIEGAVHIPMHEIPSRLNELDPGRDIVVYCHHGFRSLSVAKALVQAGFPRVSNLSGGIDAWSHQIDPQVPRY